MQYFNYIKFFGLGFFSYIIGLNLLLVLTSLHNFFINNNRMHAYQFMFFVSLYLYGYFNTIFNISLTFLFQILTNLDNFKKILFDIKKEIIDFLKFYEDTTKKNQ